MEVSYETAQIARRVLGHNTIVMSSSKAAKSRTDEPVEALPQDSESARQNDESDAPSGGDPAKTTADSTEQETNGEPSDAASKAQDRLARFKALKARAVSSGTVQM
jgi:pre-mRNA-splicing factor SYF2